MRKIVVPTDFSENAFDALKYAAELFKYERSEFFLLHAYADEVFEEADDLSREFLEELKSRIKSKADAELEKTKSRILEIFPNPKHEFKTVSAFGLLIDEVNDLAERENADLIITSTRGVSDDRKLTFGSNSLQIIKYVQCPVLSIPASYSFRDLKRVLFPSNFMLPYQRRELKLVGDLVRSICAEIHLLYISKYPQETLRQKEHKAAVLEQFYNIKITEHFEELDDKAEVIKKLIPQLNIDLLVLVNSRHSYLENLLYTSTIDKIGFDPKIPFLVLQNFYRL
ncbi:MAG: universal stress protein [Salinimicrobium sediminis]|uniref:Nucleotide-binding universal stress protein, UspA family n=1 Tax=Salinimicrobium sediminis TaxID=1343891 RepID=A0A285X9N9_9FLAO|nr:universal stress protein [Salinimicrobium sediminis]MDX1601759.1 universal stress protein [Salinimicrobium sediminis]MDX1753083.1 universal stress protein [Salinimicrobium sediminis]SOC81149.1 Nucleotide-binding universal stress protein, UspA family [Salinimicrobium sediminis]